MDARRAVGHNRWRLRATSPAIGSAEVAIELISSRHEVEGAYLFVEDEGRVLRFALAETDVRIGRDQTNDIWIDNQQVRPQTCLVYARDGAHHLKVFEGAKVLLNSQPVRGLSRLYSGDRILVGDRELMYARDDSPAPIAVGLTVILDGVVQYGLVYRRTRVRLGRAAADLVLNDPSVSERHLVIECYSDRGIFAFDLGSESGTLVNGRRVDERCRLGDGDIVQLGRCSVRVHVLPVEAHGLLLAAALPDRPKVPLAAPKPMDRAPNQRVDPGAHSPQRRQADARPTTGGFVRPAHSPNASVASENPADLPVDRRPPAPEPLPPAADPDAPLPTQIGSLADIARQIRTGDLAPIPSAGPGEDFDPPTDRGPQAQPGGRGSGMSPVEMPAIRINPQSIRPTAPPQQQSRPEQAVRPARPVDESVLRENLKVRPPEPLDESRMVPIAGAGKGRGFHDQATEMIESARVFEEMRNSRDSAVPLTAVLDTELPPPLPPMTRDQRLAEEWEQTHARGGGGAKDLGPRYRLSKTSGSWDPEPPARADLPNRDDRGPPRRDAEPLDRPPPVVDRYRLGRSSGAHDRPIVQDDRPRVQPRPLSEAERRANPDWSSPERPAQRDDPADPSQRPRQQRVIDPSRRLDPDRDR